MPHKFGKIKVYGEIIDLDFISTNELIDIKKILDARLEELCEKYEQKYKQF